MIVTGYQLFYPAHSVFREEGIDVGNIGRSPTGLLNPGAPDTDPDHASILLNIFEGMTVFCLNNDHGAGNKEHTHFINFLGECVPNHPRIVPWNTLRLTKKGEVIVVPGDTFVVNPKGLPHGELCRVVVVSRTRDCCTVVLYNPRTGVFAIVHLSIDTLYGFHFGNGGILDEPLFELLGKTENIFAMLGPCISGIAYGVRKACYEFGRGEAERILSKANIPSDPLLVQNSDKDSCKVNIAYGELIVRELEKKGIARNHIDVSNNFCTFENFSTFFSARKGSIQKDNELVPKRKREEIEEELETKRGNLTYILPRIIN